MYKPPFLLAIVLLVGAYIFMPLKIDNSPITERLITIQGNTLKAISNPNYVRPIVHIYTLGCLMMEESTNNPNAYNPDDPNGGSCGCLQFQKPTFQNFCIVRYHLANSTDGVWNCEISRRCADRMISDGYGYLWATWDRCY